MQLIQDFVNTLDVESGADDLESFLTDDRVSALSLRKRDLPALRRLREALRAVCLAHAGLPAPTEPLGELLAAAPLTVAVSPDGGARLRPARELKGVAVLTARIAATIASAAADGTWDRLKACEADDCRWAYYDRSPAGRRRWCTMAVCGSRAKMRAYRTRQR
nr:CGNR zinc finger domain-containing protein [Streptomyces coryli]